MDFGAGEWEAISLAVEIGPHYLLMDDREPVEFARSLGLPVLTTPSLLRLAKGAGLISTVRDRLDALRANGFWLHEGPYQRILQECGEA
jgi:predicted nucleic acid-binding protein